MTGRWARTRWRPLGGGYRWRAGLVRGEWWIGARYDFAAEVWMVGILGFVVIVGKTWP